MDFDRQWERRKGEKKKRGENSRAGSRKGREEERRTEEGRGKKEKKSNHNALPTEHKTRPGKIDKKGTARYRRDGRAQGRTPFSKEV